jgi:hypothetical protein
VLVTPFSPVQFPPAPLMAPINQREVMNYQLIIHAQYPRKVNQHIGKFNRTRREFVEKRGTNVN